MTTPETLTYREAAHLLLAQAQEELEAGDLRQASEKGWGAAAQIMKAYAEHRGWPHRAHWMLNQAVENVVEETGDQSFLDLFNGAQGLHTNFYEMWLPPLTVRWNLNRVEQFIPRLDSLLP